MVVMRRLMDWLRSKVWWLVPALVALGVVRVAVQRAAVPATADWEAAAAVVRAGLAPGDGVAWAPYWAGEGRVFLHGLPGFHLPEIEAADLARYERVWLMGAFGRDADDLPAGHRLIARQVFGGVTLDQVQVGGERVVGDLLAALEGARVERVGGSQREACDFWDGRGGHCTLAKSPDATRACLGQPIEKRLRDRRRDPHCGLDAWLNVSRDVRVIGDHPRRCVWFHPMQGKTLRLTWPDAPAGDSVVVDHGFADQMITDHTRKEVRTRPARLVVWRGEAGEAGAREQVGERVVEPVKGWHRWRLPRGSGPLVIEASTEATVDAHLCIDVTVRVEGAR
jgi:hypothetical protein